VSLDRPKQGKGFSISEDGRAGVLIMNPNEIRYQDKDAVSPALIADVENVLNGTTSGLRTRAGGGNRRADFQKISSKTGGATRYTDAADEHFRRMADEARQAVLPLQDPRREFTDPEEQLFHNMWIFTPQRKRLRELGLNGENSTSAYRAVQGQEVHESQAQAGACASTRHGLSRDLAADRDGSEARCVGPQVGCMNGRC